MYPCYKFFLLNICLQQISVDSMYSSKSTSSHASFTILMRVKNTTIHNIYVEIFYDNRWNTFFSYWQWKHLRLFNVSKRYDIWNRALPCQRPLWLSKPGTRRGIFETVQPCSIIEQGRLRTAVREDVCLFCTCVDMFERESNGMGLVRYCSASIAFDTSSMIGNPDSRRYRLDNICNLKRSLCTLADILLGWYL